MSQDQPAPPKTQSGGHLLIDLGPVAVFMVVYNIANRMAEKGQAIYWATGVFIVATLIALAYAWLVQKRTPYVLLFTQVVVLLFGGLTMALHDPIYIKIKPTVVNLFYAVVIFGGLLFKRNLWREIFKSSFNLPDRIWRILAIRWGLFFIFLAALNEFVWRTQSEAFWANFKFFGVFPLTFIFALANLPIVMKHTPPEEPKPVDPAPPA